MEQVAPCEGQGRAEERQGDQGPPLVLTLEGPDQYRDGDEAQEQEERERHSSTQLAEKAAPEEDGGGGGEDEEDAEAELQGVVFSLAARFAITLWWRP